MAILSTRLAAETGGGADGGEGVAAGPALVPSCGDLATAILSMRLASDTGGGAELTGVAGFADSGGWAFATSSTRLLSETAAGACGAAAGLNNSEVD